MFYWTRGNESVSGLDTLQLAQYTVEDHYTSVSEAVYETGNNDFQSHRLMLRPGLYLCLKLLHTEFRILVIASTGLSTWRQLSPLLAAMNVLLELDIGPQEGVYSASFSSFRVYFRGTQPTEYTL